jgi:sulfonate transport system substrate-binding protein
MPPWTSRLVRRVQRLGSILGMAALMAHGADAAPLTVAVAKSPHSLPIFVALSEGMFEAEGLTVQAIEAPSGRRCLKLMAEGKADLGTAAETAIAFESFERTNFSVVATFSSTSSDVALVARKAAGIHSAADLVGKRIGVAPGTSAHYFLDNFLLKSNIDPKRVEQVHLPAEKSVDALLEGKVDALSVFQPYAYAAAHTGRIETVVLSDTGGYKQTFNLVVQKAFLAARKSDVERFLKAMQRANEFIRSQPRRAEGIFVKSIGVDPAFATWSMQKTHLTLSLDDGLARILQSQANWALREGAVPAQRALDFRTLIDPSPLRAVVPNAAGGVR